jgi:hypothetical protein
MSEERHVVVTHNETDIDFKVYYTQPEEEERQVEAYDLTGIYLFTDAGEQKEDFIELLSDDVKADLAYEINAAENCF